LAAKKKTAPAKAKAAAPAAPAEPACQASLQASGYQEGHHREEAGSRSGNKTTKMVVKPPATAN
jgi:hypothetical protein